MGCASETNETGGRATLGLEIGGQRSEVRRQKFYCGSGFQPRSSALNDFNDFNDLPLTVDYHLNLDISYQDRCFLD
jgi:hypothetical protein